MALEVQPCISHSAWFIKSVACDVYKKNETYKLCQLKRFPNVKVTYTSSETELGSNDLVKRFVNSITIVIELTLFVMGLLSIILKKNAFKAVFDMIH